jgi:tRNA pseudouridine55 synthase
MGFPFTGVIPVDKPPGISSRRVVDAVARPLGMRAVGHAGTLDPLASGVVVVLVGNGTRLVDWVHALAKRYAGGFLLGRSSPSDDTETTVTPEATPVLPTHEAIREAAAGFVGEILQRPCDYSAVHVEGRRAYALARSGRPVSLPPKRVRIDHLAVTAYDWPRLELEVVCSTGTFIRAIGRDLAERLGTRAVMASLVRTAVGPFEIGRSVPLATIQEASRAELAGMLLPAVACLPHLPRVECPAATIERLVRGGLLGDLAPPDAEAAAVDEAGDLVGILRPHASGGHRLRPNFRGR